jgi:membrane protein DedA with SNARE-associated domain
MGDFIAQLVTWAIGVISTIGYPGITFLIALEAVFPLTPSEVVLSLAGSLSATGRFNFVAVLASATLGSLIGASILYGVGRLGGEERIGNWLDRYGKWLLLTRDDLQGSRAWFRKYGSVSVMLARIIPGMRTIVSVPAGLAHMPYPEFLLFTGIGTTLWNGVLVGAGYFLGNNWDQVQGWLAPIGPIVYGIMFLVIFAFIGRRLWTRFGPPVRGTRD